MRNFKRILGIATLILTIGVLSAVAFAQSDDGVLNPLPSGACCSEICTGEGPLQQRQGLGEGDGMQRRNGNGEGLGRGFGKGEGNNNQMRHRVSADS